MIMIPDNLWIGDKEQYEELIDEYFKTDDFIEGQEDIIAKMVKGLKDEPLVLEYLGIY